ncbi:copper resistance system multicopper oxidase [Inquilinus sp. Marseille-Q2685]|uniref:copper resistance system multicopper oxidase n=1 Tax=Inquilinus sp. Marseille-Q2685 TaxID=2866581 RepID=UPI001CE46E5B|nr:copper resistance system multicopper oxidase [Inquilinus sp. Marseille-Q2685]
MPNGRDGDLSRRDILKLAGASGVAGLVSIYPGRRSFAQATKTYRLDIRETRITVDGVSSRAVMMGGSVPAPTMNWTEGDEIVVQATNRLDEPSSIHWHGLLIAGVMDGAPGFNGFVAIPPGGTYTYRFKLRQAGTYWYHSHSAGQEQSGMYGAIVIQPAAANRVRADRDYVVVLSDHTQENPRRVLANLKVDAAYYNRRQRTLIDFLRDGNRDGYGAAIRDRLDWGEMRMDPTDLADVTGYAFLVNGRGPQDNWTGLFRPGERVRLRFINASAMSFFDVRIPGLAMTVVAADGQDVEPVSADEFRFGVGETYDVIVTPPDDAAYTIFAEPIDRTGYARATLATRHGLEGPIPERRARTILSMNDMGMDHGSMDMSGTDMSGMDHSSMDMSGMDMSGMDHSSMNMSGMDMSGMDHSSMDMSGMDMSGMDHSSMTAGGGNGSRRRPFGWADADTPAGKKALTYADLRAAVPSEDRREPTQEIELRLTGIMERYIWTLNGEKFARGGGIRVPYGERVRLRFVNTTMMAHPMHLHGMFVELENGQADAPPRKHVVVVPPGQTVTALLTADEPGDWPFHCHLLYHMESGMMTRFIVEQRAARS